MPWSISLVVDDPAGVQKVRPPRRTDAVGASLRKVFGSAVRLPDDMAALLRKLDRSSP